jgi:hypothetical protein
MLQDIVCAVNTQHDCAKAACADNGTVAIMQERKESGRTRPAIAHRDDDHFLLNTSSLHNYQHILAVLPPHLRGSASSLTPSHAALIREQASDQVRDQRHVRAEAQKALAMEKIMGAARSSGSNELLNSLRDDGELLEVFSDVLADAGSANSSTGDHPSSSSSSQTAAPNEDTAMEVSEDVAQMQIAPTPSTL